MLKKFLCWLFFSLDISNDQYKLQIKKIQWSCHGAANFVTNEWLLSMNSRGSVENIIDAVIHPNWEKIVMNH